PRLASCTLPRRYCQIPPPQLPLSAGSAPPPAGPRFLSRSADKSAPLCPSPAAKLLPVAGVPVLSSIAPHSFFAEFAWVLRTSCESQTLSVSASDPLRNVGKITLAHPRAPAITWRPGNLAIVRGATNYARCPET